MAFAETANLAVKLTLGGNFRSQLSKATADLHKFNKDASRGYKAGVQIGTGIKRGALLAGAGLGALATGIAKSVDLAGDFQAQLNIINTIAHKTPAELNKVGDAIRTIAKDTGLGLDDLTQGYYDLLSAGVKTADAQAVLNDAVKLGIGGLATTAQAVDLLTTAYNAYHLTAAGAAKATDQFALAIQDGKVTADEIAASFANIAPVARAYKVGIDQIAASYAVLTAQGTPGAEVATEMQRAIVSLVSPTKALAKAGKEMKVDFTKEIAKKGLVATLQEIRKYSDKTGVPLNDLLGRIEAVKYTLGTTGPNFQGFNAELAKMGTVSGVAAAQMAERQQGLNFQLARLKALAKDAGITIGSALLPKLTPVVSALNDFIQQNQGKIADFGAELAGAFTPEGVISGIKGIADALGPLIELVKVAAAPVKAITQAFLSLPKEVQTVLIGAFAVNKLTGGLVTNAAGGIIEAIGKGLLGGIKAPLVNVQGGVVNVGGGVPGAGVPGAAPTGLSGLQKVFLVGEAIGLAVAVNEVRQAISDGNSQHATEIQNQTRQFIASQPDQASLEASLAGVNTGIHDLEFNPLNVLVQGDALDKLRQMRNDLQKALLLRLTPSGIGQGKGSQADVESRRGNISRGLQQVTPGKFAGKEKDDREAVTRAIAAAATDKAKTADIEDMRAKIAAGLTTTTAQVSSSGATVAGAALRAGYGVEGAVRASRPIVTTNVDVKVTAGGIVKTVTVNERYGPVGGSRTADNRNNLGGSGAR